MKKLSLALISVLTISTATFAQTSGSSSGNIVFEGTVTDAACSILPITPVDLGSLSTKTLKGGNTAWGVSEIKFVDCNLDVKEAETKITKIELTTVAGAADPTKDALWANNGSADNVAVQVRISGKEITPAGVTQPILTNVQSNGTASFGVSGRMVKTSDAVTPGTVSTSVRFVATYK